MMDPEKKRSGPPVAIVGRRPLTLHVSAEMAEQIKELAALRRVTVSEMARRLLARSLRNR